jgi:hypothetical protein
VTYRGRLRKIGKCNFDISIGLGCGSLGTMIGLSIGFEERNGLKNTEKVGLILKTNQNFNLSLDLDNLNWSLKSVCDLSRLDQKV